MKHKKLTFVEITCIKCGQKEKVVEGSLAALDKICFKCHRRIVHKDKGDK